MAVQTPTATSATRLVPFSLKGTDERIYGLGDIRGENGTLLMFICNHCPCVRAVIDRLVEDCRALQSAGIGCAAIMPNDTIAYPADSFEKMKLFAAEHATSDVQACPRPGVEAGAKHGAMCDAAGMDT